MNQIRRSALAKISKGSAFVLLGIAIASLLGFAKDIVLARSLGTEGFGVFSIALSAVMIISILSLIGFDRGLVYYISTNLRRRLTKNNFIVSSFKLPLLISALTAFLLFIFRSQIALLFHSPSLAQALAYFSFAVPFYVLLELAVAVARGHQNLVPEVVIKNIGRVFLFLSFIFVALYFKLGIKGMSIAFLLSYLLASIFAYFYAKKSYRFPVIGSAKQDYQKKMFGYSWPLFLASSLQQVVNRGALIIAGLFLASSLVGVFAASQKLAAFVAVPLSVLIPMFFPVISQLIGEKRSPDAVAIFQSLTKWLILLTLPFFAFAFVFSEKILLLVYGSGYSGNGLVFQLLMIGPFISLVAGPIQNLLMANHWTKLVLLNTALAAIVNIGLSLILIPRFGINGAAIAVTSAIVVNNALAHLEYYWNKKRFLFPNGALRCFLIVGVVFGGLLLAKELSLVQIALPFILVAAIFLEIALVLHLKLVNKNDYYLIGLAKKKLMALIRFRSRDETC